MRKLVIWDQKAKEANTKCNTGAGLTPSCFPVPPFYFSPRGQIAVPLFELPLRYPVQSLFILFFSCALPESLPHTEACEPAPGGPVVSSFGLTCPLPPQRGSHSLLSMPPVHEYLAKCPEYKDAWHHQWF